MFKKITSTMEFPSWMAKDSRWRCLTIYDKLLDGCFYDHLPNAFYDEKVLGKDVPLSERRPSSQYRLPRYVARWAARKLFAGRHIPKVRSKDAKLQQKITDMLTGTHIWPTMFEAAYRGSVGAVAITFRYNEGKFGLKIWRAVWCSPVFDDFGELALLRVHYCTTGNGLATIGILVKEPTKDYWFIRDYGKYEEITYNPMAVEDWNPVEGAKNGKQLTVPENGVIRHNLGFVPGVWIKNPGGCMPPDGAALWEDAIPNMIEVDYLLSQGARGARYNGAPQLVTKGEVVGIDNEEVTRGPNTRLAFKSDTKDPEGTVIGGGDAKLLEMDGKGTEAVIALVELLKKLALEQIGVVQKDPGELPGPLSGRAMEFLDEDAHDTAMQWRATYGDGGALALICKMVKTVDKSTKTDGVWLQWPRIYMPTPGDVLSIAEALQIVAQPSAVQGAAAGEDGSVPVMPPLLDPAKATAYLEANLDLGILDDTYEGAVPGGEGDLPPPDGDENGAGGDNSQGTRFSPFWRIFPPLRVRG